MHEKRIARLVTEPLTCDFDSRIIECLTRSVVVKIFPGAPAIELKPSETQWFFLVNSLDNGLFIIEYGRTRAAAQQIIKRCREENILVAYIAERGSAEMIDMLVSVFDEEEAQRIYFNDLLRKETAGLTKQVADQEIQISDQETQISNQRTQISDQKEQLAEKDKQLAERDRALAAKDKQLAEEREQAESVRRDALRGRLDAIINTGLALGADHPSIVRQLAEQGSLGKAEAEQYLNIRLAGTE